MRFIYQRLLALLSTNIIISVTDGVKLNDYILDYQPLDYDRIAVHNSHQRVRRSVDKNFYLKFSAFGRDFHLLLSPTVGVFSSNHELYSGGIGPRYVDTSFLYEGHVKGRHKSAAYLSIINGSVEGHVALGNSAYHIEPASKYLNQSWFHTIIYKNSHLNHDPYYDKRGEGVGACGLFHPDIHAHIERMSQSAEDDGRKSKENGKPHNIYTEYSNNKQLFHRHKRGTSTGSTCSLHMRADKELVKFYKDKTGKDSLVEDEILALFGSHVTTLNNIYGNTLFQTYDKSLRYPSIRFSIYRSTIIKDCHEENVDSQLCDSSNIDVSNYLKIASSDNHDPFCLVVTMTYRDFSDGVLGLAWVADINNVNSGVCGKHTVTTQGKISQNSAIVTIVNYGRVIPTVVSHLTLAHEVGHNFGSPHDIGSNKCAPYRTSDKDADGGNYLMFQRATTGSLKNNGKLSDCSKDNISHILDQIFNGRRDNCFHDSDVPFCGNKITEIGEQCDCGFHPCPDEYCCIGRHEGNENTSCTIHSQHICSPTAGLCCDESCQYMSEGDSCLPETECTQASACLGNDSVCPLPQFKIGTFCDNHSRVCQNGECTGSLCSKIMSSSNETKWVECYDPLVPKDMCHLACRNPTTTKCVSSSNIVALKLAANEKFFDMLKNVSLAKGDNTTVIENFVIASPPGSFCRDEMSYCDILGKCQHFDSEGPFNQLTKLIFNPVRLSKIKDWIIVHWWAVLIMGIGVVVFMVVFMKVFGYVTPGYNPSLPRGRPTNHHHGRRFVHGAATHAPNVMNRAQYKEEMTSISHPKSKQKEPMPSGKTFMK